MQTYIPYSKTDKSAWAGKALIMNLPDDPKTRDLAALFALSPDAVLGVRRAVVAFANAAAARLFGRDVSGERLRAVLPELDLSLCRESFVTAVTLQDVRRTVCLTVQQEWTILTILRDMPVSGSPNTALLSRMRSAVFNLRVSLDRMSAAQPAPDDSARIAYHSYYSLQHLIGQLSDAEALVRGEPVLRMQVLELGPLLRELADSVSFFLKDRCASITCEVAEGEHIVRGDRERLEQLVLILLHNSLQHTPAGGHIRLSLRSTARQVVLSVDDDGEGMDGSTLSGVFSPRADADPAAAVNGTGLGLSIAYELARAHGGSIVLQSEPGRGTRVRVALPRCAALTVRDIIPSSARGPELILTELSGVLPTEAYDPKFRQ